MAKKKEAPPRRQRRGAEQRIADLQAKIAAFKEREARKRQAESGRRPSSL